MSGELHERIPLRTPRPLAGHPLLGAKELCLCGWQEGKHVKRDISFAGHPEVFHSHILLNEVEWFNTAYKCIAGNIFGRWYQSAKVMA